MLGERDSCGERFDDDHCFMQVNSDFCVGDKAEIICCC